MSQRHAAKGLDDMFLCQHGAQRARHIGELCGKPVIEIRMDQHFYRLAGDQADGLDGGFRTGDIVIPVRQPEGEVLTEIANRC